uniref:PEGA domain-containing protein n=1 Tax=Candidatus Methanophagaceae archaeon ANME-1 ERB6 TaxID=2759912 RepID=A0A7G9YWL5_9EURY|nr:hypothetical protein IAKEDICC_00020 [Methanosarcinales archaeon ANME-1 ERB6]
MKRDMKKRDMKKIGKWNVKGDAKKILGIIGVVIVAVGLLAGVVCSTAVQPPESYLKVTSSPSGAEITITGFVGPIATTPHLYTDFEPGTYTINLHLDGYHDWSTKVQVIAHQPLTVHATLSPKKTTGSISVTSSPSSANVYLDNTYKGITPLTITDVSQGHHSIEYRLNGYKNCFKSVQVTAGKTSDVYCNLQPVPPAPGSISVSSSPSGASIYLDGAYRGRTPEIIRSVSSGDHTIKLERDGYYDWSTTVGVTAGATSYVSAPLRPIPYPTVGFISVTSSPSGACIYLDGSYKGTTPKTLSGVSPGAHTIEVERSGYNDWKTTVRVTAGATSYVSAPLSPIPYPTTGFISVSSSPSGANIYLDGAYRGTTPHTIVSVASGHHTVSLDLSGYQHYETGVDVSAGGTSSVSASLVLSPTPSPTSGTISVSSSPSGAYIYLDDTYKGIAPLTITDVSPGTHAIKATLAGYEDWSTNTEVTSGSTASVSASLTHISTPTPTPTPKAPTTVLSVIAALGISGIIAAAKVRRGGKYQKR